MSTEEQSFLGTAADFGGFIFAESSLSMLKRSARSGFKVPIFGRRKYGWGAINEFTPLSARTFGAVDALEMFEKSGYKGFRNAYRGVVKKFGVDTARNVGARYFLGRAAGSLLTGTWAVVMAQQAWDIAWTPYNILSGMAKQTKGLELGGNYFDNQQSYTSRQRAVKAITSSQLQARSAIGNEGFLMHR